METQKQQHSQQRRTSASTPSLLLVAAAATIPTLLHAFAPNMAVHNNKRPMVQHHQSSHKVQVQRQQLQPSSTLVSKQVPFLGRTSSITFARGPRNPSASLEEDDDDDDDDLDFDEEDADDDEGKQL